MCAGCCGVVDLSPCCQTSGIIFWGKQGLRLLLLSISDYFFHVSMGLLTVQSQLWDCHQCVLQRRAARPWCVVSAIPLFPFLLRVLTAPRTGTTLCKPPQSWQYTQGLNFQAQFFLTVHHCTLPLALSFLGNSFFVEINLFGQRFSLWPLGLFSRVS